MKYKIPFLVALMSASTISLGGSETSVEHLIVTGTYASMPVTELTSSVSVLDSETIKSLSKRNIADLLKTVPGLLVEEQGGPGGLTAVSIRGGEANFTLVLLDGVPLSDPTNFRGGGFDFANLSASLVERIEVVRGAQSAIYGSDALAGVINIITRRPVEGHSQQLYAEWGEDDYSDLGVNALGRVGNFDYTVELAARDDGEPVEGSTRESDKAKLRLGWQPVEGHDLSLAYSYLDGQRSSYPEESGGPLYALSEELDTSDYEDAVLSLGWEAQFSSLWRSALTASRFEHEERYRSPGIPPYLEVPANGADTHYRNDRLQWVNTLQPGRDYQLNLGADYRDEAGDSKGYLFYGVELPTDFELDRSTTGLFADVSASPADGLLLQGALRFDDPDGFDEETSVRLGASYELGASWRLAANWGQAFKLPSFFALGHALVRNPDLKPELADSWDLGLAWQASESLRLEATYFFNDYEDLITFDSELFINVNREQVETSGMELQALWRPLPQFSLQAQATYTDIDVQDSTEPLTGRPDWSAGFVAQWQLADRWHTVLDYHYTGEQYAASRHTGESVMQELDDYHRLDWVLRWDALEAVQLQLSLDNLLDETYQSAVGFPGPGRAVRLGVRLSHN